ncbi:MAG: zinc-binding dehydrogenase [Planctomycetes bacterium]|nr:zinc-binding dehydrogenase [Planctomycetota bacterium]
MRALEISRQGSPVAANVQFVSDRAAPEPGSGEVLVQTEASALNHLDLWVGRGMPGIPVKWPTVGGSDGAGKVTKVGPGADASWIGRRVVLMAAVEQPQSRLPNQNPAGEEIHMIGEHSPGTHAEFFTAPVTNILDIGEHDPLDAAAVGLTHLTAYRMLVTKARVAPGAWVLITGIGGGVAVAALALARHLGCRTIVTSRHAWKLEKAKSLGAEHVILDEGSDWSKQVRGCTDRRGVDAVIDSIGMSILPQSIKSLARGGAFVTCGCTSGSEGVTDLARVFWNQLSILGSTMGSMDEFRSVLSLFKSGAIKPVIDSTHAAKEGRAAYARLEAGEQFGKVMIDWRK